MPDGARAAPRPSPLRLAAPPLSSATTAALPFSPRNPGRSPNVRNRSYLATDSYPPTLTRGGPRNGVRSLVGRTWCKVDASYSPIDVGDLLTTSPTAAHAMKATDQRRSFGAVIGKALRPLRAGQGLIPILIALQ